MGSGNGMIYVCKSPGYDLSGCVMSNSGSGVSISLLYLVNATNSGNG